MYLNFFHSQPLPLPLPLLLPLPLAADGASALLLAIIFANPEVLRKLVLEVSAFFYLALFFKSNNKYKIITNICSCSCFIDSKCSSINNSLTC